MTRLWSLLVSLRTTAVLLVVLSALLVLRVALPQAADGDAYVRAVRGSASARFLLETMGLGSVATSPPFLAALAAFFANLAAVLTDRTGATLRRLRAAPPTEAQVAALLAAPSAKELAGVTVSAEAAADLLRRLGYRVRQTAGGATWGVKHALALLGFPVFHASFFLLAAGGALLYLTRDVGTLVVTEGIEASSGDATVVRRAPLGAPPPFRLALDRVDVGLEDGRPVGLRAAFRLDGAATESRVNHPAERGALAVLVERCGIAPVLWLTDPRGFTVDRVLVPAANPAGVATRVELGSGGVEVAVEPIPVGLDFPERAGLGRVGVPLRVFRGGAKVFEGRTRPGEGIAVGDHLLRVQEVRYWAGFRLVNERGGGLLMAGFALSVIGIVWRMAFFRREVVVASTPAGTRIGGRGEFYPSRVHEEVELLAELLSDAGRTGRERSSGT